MADSCFKGEKGKLLSAQPRKTTERAVSLPPNLRTIREQQSLENIEEAVLAATGPSPIHEFIELMRKSRTFPSSFPDHDDFWSDDSGDKGQRICMRLDNFLHVSLRLINKNKYLVLHKINPDFQ